jgi:GR25 family glycosyltransferase involved in LPS biosynthesis
LLWDYDKAKSKSKAKAKAKAMVKAKAKAKAKTKAKTKAKAKAMVKAKAKAMVKAKAKAKAKRPNILFTITSCKRFDLFEKTINSIMNTWTDLNKVDSFFCVDDNSRQIDRSKMTKAYPFFDYHMKTKAEKGHRASMNIIYNKLKELEPTYWIHLEDDWLFFQESAYVQKSMDFLESYESAGIHQILYNRNYAEIYEGWTINGSEQLNKDFLVHVKSDAIPGQNCGYWPHYSFRPSMIRTKIILELGNYDSPNTFFERDYADKYFAKAYRSGFFNTVSCLHTGKLTSDKTGTNAYTLNKMGQFSAAASGKQSTFVVNLLRRTDRKEEVEKAFEAAGIDDYEFYEAVDGSKLELTEEISSLFLGNDFGSRRGVIGCALSHLDLWKQLKADPTIPFYTVFEDDITLCEDFKTKLEASKKDLEGVDLIFLGYHVRSNYKESVLKGTGERVPIDNNIFVGGTFGYIVTQSGCKKLLDYISINGIKHGIDYLMKIVPGIKTFNPQPHIIFSDWLVSSESAVDTDIQRDYSSLKIVQKVSKDDWIFYEGVDSGGNDIHQVGGKSVDELMAIGMEVPTCVAFNTLGYLKSKVNLPLRSTPYIYSAGSGIYVKKGYNYKECMNTRILEKDSYEKKDLVGLAGRCDWFVYHSGFINLTNTSNPSTVFLHAYKGDKSLEKFMNEYLPSIKAPFNLIVASDDSTFPSGNGDARHNYYANKKDMISTLLQNPNLHKIYVENLDTAHAKISAIPLGILKNGLQGYHSSLEIMDFPIDFSSKPLDCFCIHRTRGGEQWNLRKKVSELCKKEWSGLVNYHEGDTLGHVDIYRHMRKSKFCLCIRGGGYDPSPKCWEAIMNGCIPIIEHSPLDEVYSKFPVVFIDSWDAGSLTKEKMQQWLADLRPFYEDPEKRKVVLDMLTLDYWWNIIRLPKHLVSSRPWISPILSGGIGNRLFQMSAALGLSEKLNRPVVVHTPNVYPTFHQELTNIYSIFPDIALVHTKVEDIHCISENVNDVNKYKDLDHKGTDKPILISGYRQSYKYFPTGGVNLKLESLVDPIRWEELLGKYGLDSKSNKLRTWFIHVRLGDYVSNGCVNHVTVDNYHKKALAAAAIPSGANIIVFSDEPEKVTDILRPYLRNPFTVCRESDEIVSLALMSQCWAGAIVPNSTFSWWGSYLAHEKTSSPNTYKAYYPNIWNAGIGVISRDTIPSWGTMINIVDDDEWVFHLGLDTGGGDIHRSESQDIVELKFAASRHTNCAAFNTLGFLKSRVNYPLVKTPWIHAPGGLYVKKSYVRSCRVKMLCNWCSSQDLCKEWLKMSKGNYRWNDIEITWEDADIDYYVIINRPPPGAQFVPEKTIVFHMEPWCGDSTQSWGVKTWGEWAKPDPAKFLQVRSHANFINTVFWQVNMTYTQLKESQVDKKNPLLDKTVASICSSKYFDPGHKKRIDFMKYIESKQDPAVTLHLFNEDNKHNFKSYQGKAQPSVDKERGILPYKYYFMCENNAEKNFITEKLWEPILCETLCFYWGCPNVADYIDTRAFVQLDIEDFEGSFQVVKQAIQDNLWEQRLPFIIKEKQKILEFYGFFPTIERILKPKTICFIHSCNMGTEESKEILTSILNAAKGIKELGSIVINNIGKPLDIPFYTSQDNRIKVINYSEDIKLFELPTLKLIHDFCRDNQNTKVLYLHTKGVSYSNTLSNYTNMIQWRDMMLYFMCEKSEDCLRFLDTRDTVGCNFSEHPRPHYSGNFWWATSKYLSKLSKEDLTDKMSAEWWILSKNPSKYVAHNSGINHFQRPYPRSQYESNTIRYISGGKLGDFIHQLSIVNENYLKTSKKGILYLSNKGDEFSLGFERAYNDICTFIKMQPYIHDFKIHSGEEYDIDLSSWRNSRELFKCNWYSLFKNEYGVEWGSHPWLFTETPKSSFANTIFLNCVPTRFPTNTDFKELFERIDKDRVCFITGNIEEYNNFFNKTGINLEVYIPTSLYDMIHSINSCKYFIGNPSSPLTYAHALHKENKILINEPIMNMFFGNSSIPNTTLLKNNAEKSTRDPINSFNRFVPTFHILIATGGRPTLLNMLNSLKKELTSSDAITIVFDGPDARKKSQYTDKWIRDHKCVVKTIDQIPNIGAGIGSEPVRNIYQSFLNPVTTFIMHADDDDVYLEGSFNILRKKCRNPDILYIARIKCFNNIIIPAYNDEKITIGNIGSVNGIIPFNDASKASWGIMKGGDYIYYNDLQNKVKGVQYLPDIIYRMLQEGDAVC